MANVKFSEQNLKRVEKIQGHYPNKEASLLMVLHLANDEFGCLSDDVYGYVSELTGVPKSKIYSVATFYSMYNQKPVGKYHVQVCKNISCMITGSDDLLEHIKNRLKINTGETTADKMFTLSAVECLGCCNAAPVMMINKDFHENLTAEKIDAIIDELVSKK